MLKVLIFIFCLLTTVVCTSQNNTLLNQRQEMVESQLKARGISDERVLDAFETVPRHEFILPRFMKYAYSDSPLPIEKGQTISQPYIVAFMTEALELQPSDRVLEVGTGSGYQAAILAQLCDSVFTVELYQLLSKSAEQIFQELGYNNIYCKVGDGYLGWPEKAPFDAIIVTCSPSHVPEALKNQLAEGGRMIIPVGEEEIQQLVVLKKTKGKLDQRETIPVRFVPMLNDNGEKY